MKKFINVFLILLSVFAGQISLLNGKEICLSAFRCGFENEFHQNCCPKTSIKIDDTCTNSQCAKRHKSSEMNGDHQCKELQIVDINLSENLGKILDLDFSFVTENFNICYFYEAEKIFLKLFYNKSPPKSWHLQFLESIKILC